MEGKAGRKQIKRQKYSKLGDENGRSSGHTKKFTGTQ
jgi:hypothetical protein